jgi:hypothetical protein
MLGPIRNVLGLKPSTQTISSDPKFEMASSTTVKMVTDRLLLNSVGSGIQTNTAVGLSDALKEKIKSVYTGIQSQDVATKTASIKLAVDMPPSEVLPIIRKLLENQNIDTETKNVLSKLEQLKMAQLNSSSAISPLLQEEQKPAITPSQQVVSIPQTAAQPTVPVQYIPLTNSQMGYPDLNFSYQSSKLSKILQISSSADTANSIKELSNMVDTISSGQEYLQPDELKALLMSFAKLDPQGLASGKVLELISNKTYYIPNEQSSQIISAWANQLYNQNPTNQNALKLKAKAFEQILLGGNNELKKKAIIDISLYRNTLAKQDILQPLQRAVDDHSNYIPAEVLSLSLSLLKEINTPEVLPVLQALKAKPLADFDKAMIADIEKSIAQGKN